MYSVDWGEQVVNGDSFQLQTFNNKFARDLPMTQASTSIQKVRSIAATPLLFKLDIVVLMFACRLLFSRLYKI